MIWLRLAQGILCAVEICGLYYLLQVFFEKRWHKTWNNVLWILSGVVIWGLTVYHRDAFAMYSRYYMIFCVILACCITMFFLKMQIKKIILIMILYFESIYFIDLFLGYIVQAITNNDNFIDEIQFDTNLNRIVIMFITRFILVVVLFFIIKYKIFIQNLFNKYLLIFAGFAVLEYIGLFFCERVFIPTFRAQGRIYIYFALFPMLIVLTLIIVIFYIMNIEKRNMIQLVNNQNELLEKNYHEMMLLYQKRDRIFHDMKNHLSVLSLLIADKNLDRAKEYISKINEPILELEHKRFTGNRIVDIILNDKLEKALNENIKLNIRANELQEGGIQDIDWCAILANVLDNAIEACSKTYDKKKEINLCINQNECTTTIEVVNTYNGEVIIKDNKLVSNKSDKIVHGLGMESIQSAVDKYNGIIEYSFKTDIFIIYISLFN